MSHSHMGSATTIPTACPPKKAGHDLTEIDAKVPVKLRPMVDLAQIE